MAGAPMVFLNNRPVWLECTPTAPKVHQEKARLVMELSWKAEEEVQRAVSRRQHQEVVGKVQLGRAGLGWREPPCQWSRAGKKERKDLVAAEMARMEQEELKVKAIAQGQ